MSEVRTAKQVFWKIVRGLAFTGAIVVGLFIGAIILIWSSESRLKAKTNFISFSKIDKAQNLSRGEGVKVAICDWCFDLRGQASNKYVDAASMVSSEPIGAGNPWHGEWMAEIVHQTAPDCKIIPIRARAFEAKKRDYQPYLINGIRYAADHGAVVVTSSMGPLRMTKALRDALAYADSKGTLFINVHPIYKMKSDVTNSNILCTGVVSVPWHRAYREPGRDIYVWPYMLTHHLLDDWGYSVGPPIVAGVVALMKSANPSLTPSQIKEIIVKTTYIKHEFRVLDAEAAVKTAMQGRMMPPNPKQFTSTTNEHQ